MGGASGYGTAFEIADTASGYAATPTVLVSFDGTNTVESSGSLIADADGDLFGTTTEGGSGGNNGTVFEIAKTAGGYASTATVLARFNYTDGSFPVAGLIADVNGDLFGTTSGGGVSGDGTVFEIVKTSAGYASAPTVLASFNGANGYGPAGSLIADASGDLFGTTESGGANDDGTVFELAKTAAGYAGTPTVLASFSGANGTSPLGSLITDASGDLFGTTKSGGSTGLGTAFKSLIAAT